MRKLLVVLLGLLVCVAMPLMAQDDKPMAKKDAEMEMGPPPALDNDYMNWMVGQWEGVGESPMGKSEIKMSCQMGLGGQFMMTEYNSKSEMGDFSGVGAMTLSQEGDVKGFWIDSMRTMAQGKGTRDGNKVTVVWEGGMGKMTRTTEMVSEDKMVVTSVYETPQGNVEGKEELTRVKMSDKKSY